MYRVEVGKVTRCLLGGELVGRERTRRRKGQRELVGKLERVSEGFSTTNTRVERIHLAGCLSSVRGPVTGGGRSFPPWGLVGCVFDAEGGRGFEAL